MNKNINIALDILTHGNYSHTVRVDENHKVIILLTGNGYENIQIDKEDFDHLRDLVNRAGNRVKRIKIPLEDREILKGILVAREAVLMDTQRSQEEEVELTSIRTSLGLLSHETFSYLSEEEFTSFATVHRIVLTTKHTTY